MSYVARLAALIFAGASADQLDQLESFVVLQDRLKTAVCDETFVSRAPTLESVSDLDEANAGAAAHRYAISLPAGTPEHEIISFLLGDSLASLSSEYAKAQMRLAIRQRGLEQAVDAGAVSGEQLVEAQAAVGTVKRRISLDVCEGLVNASRLTRMLKSKPSWFIEASPDSPGKKAAGSGNIVYAVDHERRFGVVRNRVSSGKSASRYLVPGWLEPFEVDRVSVFSGGRFYRRVSNPLTNSTQAIEVMSRAEVPLGLLFPSRNPVAAELDAYRSGAELPESRTRQIETYRQKVEFEALGSLHRVRAADSKKVRDLQEFYKNLLQAYQLFPDEKQFDAYSAAGGKRSGFEEAARSALAGPFLDALRRARVNGAFVGLVLFKPDPKLHAIYSEFSGRLAKLSR